MFYSPKPRNQVWILIYWKWSIDYAGVHCQSGTPCSDRIYYFIVRLFQVKDQHIIINCSSASRINTNNNNNINQNYSTAWQLHICSILQSNNTYRYISDLQLINDGNAFSWFLLRPLLQIKTSKYLQWCYRQSFLSFVAEIFLYCET